MTERASISSVHQLLRVVHVKTSEHLLFNFINYTYFRQTEAGNAIMLIGESRLLTLLIALPYVLGSEIAFLRQSRYFVKLKKSVVAVFVLDEEPEAICLTDLSVDPAYRRLGIATAILTFSENEAKRSHKKWVELRVLKKNTIARRLYEKYGFVTKQERKWSLVLRKRVTRL